MRVFIKSIRPGTYTCCHCKIDKRHTDFYANSTRYNGLSSICKICCSVRDKGRKVYLYTKNREWYKNRPFYYKAWLKQHPGYHKRRLERMKDSSI